MHAPQSSVDPSEAYASSYVTAASYSNQLPDNMASYSRITPYESVGDQTEGIQDIAIEYDPNIYPIAPPKSNTSSFMSIFQHRAHSLASMFMQQSTSDSKYPKHHDIPNLFKFLCFLGGGVMFMTSIFSAINILNLFSRPSYYLMQLYHACFGLTTMLIETKDWDCLDPVRPYVYKYFRFLVIPAGKGAFYVFIGTLELVSWLRSFFSFLLGFYMIIMGAVCIALHFTYMSTQQLTNTLSEPLSVYDSGSRRRQNHPHNSNEATQPASRANHPFKSQDDDEEDEDEDDNESDSEDEEVNVRGNEPRQMYQHYHNKRGQNETTTTTTTATDLTLPEASTLLVDDRSRALPYRNSQPRILKGIQ